MLRLGHSEDEAQRVTLDHRTRGQDLAEKMLGDQEDWPQTACLPDTPLTCTPGWSAGHTLQSASAERGSAQAARRSWRHSPRPLRGAARLCTEKWVVGWAITSVPVPRAVPDSSEIQRCDGDPPEPWGGAGALSTRSEHGTRSGNGLCCQEAMLSLVPDSPPQGQGELYSVRACQARTHPGPVGHCCPRGHSAAPLPLLSAKTCTSAPSTLHIHPPPTPPLPGVRPARAAPPRQHLHRALAWGEEGAPRGLPSDEEHSARGDAWGAQT